MNEMTRIHPSLPQMNAARAEQVISSSSQTITDSSSTQTITECPICMESALEMRSTSCGHHFCDACLRRYVEAQPVGTTALSCPTCRQPLSAADIPHGCQPLAATVVPSSTATASRFPSEPWTRRRCFKWTICGLASITLPFVLVWALTAHGKGGPAYS